jgi:hypothetical protein
LADNSTQNGADTIRDIDRAGIKTQVVQLDAGGSSAEALVSKAAPLPMFPVHTGAAFVNFSAVGAAAGATTVETAITLTRSGSPGATVTTGTSFTATSGKRLKITSITFASRGHATATAQLTDFTLRVNTAGATTTTSAQVIKARTATAATALAYDRISIPLEYAGIEIVGDGTLTFGVTANAVFTTNAPTWDVLITGIEY